MKILTVKFVFLFSLQTCLEYFSFLEGVSKNGRKSILVFVKISRNFYHIVIEFVFSRQNFENFSNTNFLKIRSECA